MSLWRSRKQAHFDPLVPSPVGADLDRRSDLDPAQGEQLAPAAPAVAKDSRLRIGLLLAASALGGGIAVVLYNRRLLARMREPRSPSPGTSGSFWEDGA